MIAGCVWQKAVSYLLIPLAMYYWVLLLLHDPKNIILVGDLNYFLFVVPSFAFVAIATIFMIFKKKTNFSSLAIALLILSVVVFSIYRNDISTLLSVTFLLLFVLVFSHMRPVLKLEMLNWLYLASVIISIPLYHFGLSDYGYFPGQSLSSAEEGLAWRVSLFPSIAESAIFSGIVLSLNIMFKDLPFRRIVIPFAIYFLFLSGVRSAVIATVASIGYFFVLAKLTHRMPVLSLVLLFIVLGVMIVMLYSENFFVFLSGFLGDSLNIYMFRSAADDASMENLSKTVYRTWLWQQHINALVTSHYMGMGTFSFVDILADPLITIGEEARGSESFLTGFLARIGLWGVLFPVAIVSIVMNSYRNKRFHVPVFALMFIYLSLTYGSFITPYNFVMILFMFLIYGQISHTRRTPDKDSVLSA